MIEIISSATHYNTLRVVKECAAILVEYLEDEINSKNLSTQESIIEVAKLVAHLPLDIEYESFDGSSMKFKFKHNRYDTSFKFNIVKYIRNDRLNAILN